jgi:hypothetical protein
LAIHPSNTSHRPIAIPTISPICFVCNNQLCSSQASLPFSPSAPQPSPPPRSTSSLGQHASMGTTSRPLAAKSPAATSLASPMSRLSTSAISTASAQVSGYLIRHESLSCGALAYSWHVPSVVVTVYSDLSCSDNKASARLDECVHRAAGWQSFSVDGC